MDYKLQPACGLLSFHGGGVQLKKARLAPFGNHRILVPRLKKKMGAAAPAWIGQTLDSACRKRASTSSVTYRLADIVWQNGASREHGAASSGARRL